MATNTTLLTRRSFSTWLAASGLVLTTSRRTLAQDSIESKQFLSFGEKPRPGALDSVDSNSPERWTAAKNESWRSYGQVSLERRAQDGRPPSEWLRSMDTEELRAWLAKIEVTEASVQGMTFWTHLTRDHSFRPLLIKGLTEVEQAKLHAAAHFGY